MGFDHGFLCAWFLMLVNLSIAWANATALPLIFRNLMGGVFQFGFHYRVFGYDVYFGEALLSLCVILLFGFITFRGGRIAGFVQILMACTIAGGVFIGIAFALKSHFLFHHGMIMSFDPAFSPENTPVSGILKIIALSPWAFVGFESITHSSEEFTFSPKKTLPVMLVAIIIGAVAYIALVQIAIADYCGSDSSWVSYIESLDSRSGVDAIPVFHSVKQMMGQNGIVILLFTLLAAVSTGLLANFIAVSRLIYAMARDGMLSARLVKVNDKGVPVNAVIFALLISLPVPFLGRAVIGWIVDVNTVCAALAYVYTSICAFRIAKENKNSGIMVTGVMGTVISVFFFLYFLVPNFTSMSLMSLESYLILIAWSVLGLLFFRYIFKNDSKARFGKSTVVWIILLFMIFFTSTMWVRGVMYSTSRDILDSLNEYNASELAEHGIELDGTEQKDSEYFLNLQIEKVHNSLITSSSIQMSVVLISLFIMFSLYTTVIMHDRKMEAEKIKALESSKAKSVFLSNMSHDIRTPMNAIIGYINIAKRKDVTFDEVKGYLNKIDSSSQHLLALINDVLEMSSIESGRMELEETDTDICEMIEDIRDMFATQMDSKKLDFMVSCDDVRTRVVKCDKNRINRVLLNLLSNAYKFTPENGSVKVILREIGADSDGKIEYELRVIDSGIGMSPEFVERIFDAFERERTSTNSGIQGTGLGMAITKSIVDLMGGSIEVRTKQGEGTEFVLCMSFVPGIQKETIKQEKEHKKETKSFSEMKVLLVEDIDINREMASFMLTESGFTVETAVNGKEAVERIASSEHGEFDLVLMDIQMPVMDGYDATTAIRNLDDKVLASVPIIAMTANAFAEDVKKALETGMNAHISKPIDVTKMLATIKEVLNG